MKDKSTEKTVGEKTKGDSGLATRKGYLDSKDIRSYFFTMAGVRLGTDGMNIVALESAMMEAI